MAKELKEQPILHVPPTVQLAELEKDERQKLEVKRRAKKARRHSFPIDVVPTEISLNVELK